MKKYMKSGLYFTSNGYDNLMHNGKMLYGERGDFRHNLIRYIQSPEFNTGCKVANCVEDLPELSFDEIKNQIQREEHFKQMCQSVIKQFDDLKEKDLLTDDAYLELGGIMGICPGQCDWTETLFPHLVDLFVNNQQDADKINDLVLKNKNVVAVMVECLSDGLRGGQFIQSDNKILWSQGYARNYFRGENAYNKSCKPSLFRGKTGTEQDVFNTFIDYVKQFELLLTLKQLDFIKYWPFPSHIDYTAIAQHYGLNSSYIDITSDLKVALFFACCKYDSCTKSWRPLNSDEFKNADSRQDVFLRGGDSRYGVIFQAPADVCNMSNQANFNDLKMVNVEPIGFQPFMRCSMQSAYCIPVKSIHFDLYKDPGFKKFKFRHSQEICNWIYEQMDGGKKIYPNEFSSGIYDIIEKIRQTSEFSKQAVMLASSYFSSYTYDQIEQKLNERGITIVEQQTLFTQQELRQINNEWSEKGIPYFEQLTSCFRFGFTIG